MNGNQIKTFLQNMDEYRYNCILIDGPWGIGKTYTVNNCITGKKCYISAFGIKNANQIYGELISKFLLNEDKEVISAIKKLISGVTNIVATISDKHEKTAIIKNTVASFVNEKAIFIKMSSHFTERHTVIIDDLERASDELQIKELFGVIETLKKNEKIKLLLIVNSKELGDKLKLYNKYKEKLVDKELQFESPATFLDWENIKCCKSIAEELIETNNIQNLRTLEKSEDFYQEIKKCCDKYNNDGFCSIVQKMCYGIVLEVIEKQNDKVDINDFDDTESDWEKYYSSIEFQVKKYFNFEWYSNNLVRLLAHYYIHTSQIDITVFEAEYKSYIKSGEKQNYYKSEDELLRMVESWQSWLGEADNSVELFAFARDCYDWMKLLDIDATEMLQTFEHRLEDMLRNDCRLIGSEALINDGFKFVSKFEPINRIRDDVFDKLKTEYVVGLVDILVNSDNEAEKYKISIELMNCYNNTSFTKYVESACDALIDLKILPIGSISDDIYKMSINATQIIKKCGREEQLRQLVESRKKELTKVDLYRINYVLDMENRMA